MPFHKLVEVSFEFFVFYKLFVSVFISRNNILNVMLQEPKLDANVGTTRKEKVVRRAYIQDNCEF